MECFSRAENGDCESPNHTSFNLRELLIASYLGARLPNGERCKLGVRSCDRGRNKEFLDPNSILKLLNTKHSTVIDFRRHILRKERHRNASQGARMAMAKMLEAWEHGWSHSLLGVLKVKLHRNHDASGLTRRTQSQPAFSGHLRDTRTGLVHIRRVYLQLFTHCSPNTLIKYLH